MEQKRMMRSHKDRMISGVCGGLAEYFGVDPTIVRLVFVLAALLNGIGLILYLALWLVMPEAPVTAPAAPSAPLAEEPAAEVEGQAVEVETEVEEAVPEEAAAEKEEGA